MSGPELCGGCGKATVWFDGGCPRCTACNWTREPGTAPRYGSVYDSAVVEFLRQEGYCASTDPKSGYHCHHLAGHEQRGIPCASISGEHRWLKPRE